MNIQQFIETHPNFCVELEQYRLIEIIGIDAEKYLQGQLTCDVTMLNIGQQTLTCHCDPKGKMSSLFRLYRQASDHFLMIIRKELLPEALAQLKKYAVFSKVTFNELDTPIFGTTCNDIIANSHEKLTACSLNENPNRYLLWGDNQLETNGKSELWDLLDIQKGIPILHATNQFELIPQAANLQKLEHAISFTKGCYIGQETIARAKYRGANKRAMFTFIGNVNEINPQSLPEISGNIEIKLGENWKTTGLILSYIVENNHLWLQVIMNRETQPDSEFRIGEIPLKMVPLPYHLDDE